MFPIFQLIRKTDSENDLDSLISIVLGQISHKYTNRTILSNISIIVKTKMIKYIANTEKSYS